MKLLGQYILLGIAIIGAMVVGSLVVEPVDIFSMPISIYDELYINFISYFFQGMCAALAGTIVCVITNLHKYASFNASIVVSLLFILVQSLRVGVLDLYFAQNSILPLLAGVSTGLFLIGYFQNFTSKGEATF